MIECINGGTGWLSEFCKCILELKKQITVECSNDQLYKHSEFLSALGPWLGQVNLVLFSKVSAVKVT